MIYYQKNNVEFIEKAKSTLLHPTGITRELGNILKSSGKIVTVPNELLKFFKVISNANGAKLSCLISCEPLSSVINLTLYVILENLKITASV